MEARLIVFACLVAAALGAPSTISPSTVKPECVPACPSGKAGRVPNLCDCERYYECDKNGAVTSETCLPWENFDPVKLQCAFWSTVTCAEPPTSPPPTTVPPTRPPVVPGCDFVPQCPASGKSNLGVPCPKSCGIYIACQDGQWTKESCPFYQPSFDVNLNRCVMWGATCAA